MCYSRFEVSVEYLSCLLMHNVAFLFHCFLNYRLVFPNGFLWLQVLRGSSYKHVIVVSVFGSLSLPFIFFFCLFSLGKGSGGDEMGILYDLSLTRNNKFCFGKIGYLTSPFLRRQFLLFVYPNPISTSKRNRDAFWRRNLLGLFGMLQMQLHAQNLKGSP